ncbi:hypothetical protein ZIOFF_001820 [Zingiber officinale]|uniref:Uncharacterized protein n=1 Tax=Zingiber officinale TaxID=94328 RepID=A0A8J5HVY9_ZINOF|nr:hypothetical protein ZIOFF_001820 [Zingiber officinale]
MPASEKIAYTLDKTPPKETPVNATLDELENLEKWWFEETVDAKDIHIHLQELYGAQTHSVRHATVKELMKACMRDGASIHEHRVKMIGLIEKLVNLDLLVNMLVNYEGTMEKEKSVFLVGSSSGSKKRPKKKGKKHSAIMKKIKPNKKARPTKSNQSEHVYFHYNKPGHWRRNCKEYLAQKHFGKGHGIGEEDQEGFSRVLDLGAFVGCSAGMDVFYEAGIVSSVNKNCYIEIATHFRALAIPDSAFSLSRPSSISHSLFPVTIETDAKPFAPLSLPLFEVTGLEKKIKKVLDLGAFVGCSAGMDVFYEAGIVSSVNKNCYIEVGKTESGREATGDSTPPRDLSSLLSLLRYPAMDLVAPIAVLLVAAEVTLGTEASIHAYDLEPFREVGNALLLSGGSEGIVASRLDALGPLRIGDGRAYIK